MMIKLFVADKRIFFSLIIAVLFLIPLGVQSQNSMLINFGGNACSASYLPSFSMIKDPLTVSPVLLSNCDMQAQLPNYFSVFIAYNPKNNKVYVADIRSSIETKIWVLDAGLPYSINCPATIPVDPTYSYSYVSNNFEFDNNGDLWSFSNYDVNTGQCSLDKFDVNTGLVINTRILQFPVGNFPNTIASGDLCILPNGRMFATLGSGPSQLYEITNYNTTSTANATFLAYIPKDCYGIAYLNGMLEIAGNDFQQSCYYFDYDISTGILGTEKPFQVNNAPIDNTSFTPSIGCTKQLLNATEVNSNTYNLSYEIYVKNMGNVILNNINPQDDLSATFGAGNVSNVEVSFVPGFNNGGLTLNPSYNGITNTLLLNPNQNLPNQVLNNEDYYFKLLVRCDVTNLQRGVTYFNSATCNGEIGSSSLLSQVIVSDSSNNGNISFVDPNQNGNANETEENIPTPFSIELLPVKFIDVTAKYINDKSSFVQWQIATPIDAMSDYFTIEFSSNGKQWRSMATLIINNNNQGFYSYNHKNIPQGNLYYRIKQTDKDGRFIYSKIVMLHSKTNENIYSVFPNPTNNQFTITSSQQNQGNVAAELYDATGRKILNRNFNTAAIKIETDNINSGTYFLKITDNQKSYMQKVVVLK